MRFFRKKNTVKIVFSHEYSFGFPNGNYSGIYDVLKFKKIRDRLVQEKLINRKKILIPEIAGDEDLSLVHTEEFIRRIKDPGTVVQMLKLDFSNSWDNFILDYFKIVTGGTILAAKYALNSGNSVFNLGGGFHHAHADLAAGFCLINDVAIAIQTLRKNNLAQRFVIIDLDYHQGDGNLEFFKYDSHVFTLSMHASHWLDIKKENNLDIKISADTSGDEYISKLKSELSGLCKRFKPDLVFYIAGSDPYEKDTLCDMKLTRNDMLLRNMLIFNKVQNLKIPLVILPAGGYGPDSWEVYYDFIKTAVLQ